MTTWTWFFVTAYCACVLCTGKDAADPWHGVTASGARARPAHTAACPPELAIGTRLLIPLDRDWPDLDLHLVCEDRGGTITGRRLDMFMPTHEEALRAGSKWMRVKVGTTKLHLAGRKAAREREREREREGEMKGNGRHKRQRRREQRVRRELRRRGGSKQGHAWAAKQAARRIKTHKRKGSVLGSKYYRG